MLFLEDLLNKNITLCNKVSTIKYNYLNAVIIKEPLKKILIYI